MYWGIKLEELELLVMKDILGLCMCMYEIKWELSLDY